MNGVPGTLLEQGIVGLLKCVKILVVLQSRWRLVVRIPSILLFVNPERLLLFLPIALPQNFMGRGKGREGKGEARRGWGEKKKNITETLVQFAPAQHPPLLLSSLSPLSKVLTKSKRMLCLKCCRARLGTLLFIPV